MNNLIKEIQNLSIERIKWKKDRSKLEYNTNYDIFDKDDNLILSRRKDSCFYQIFNIDSPFNKLVEFGKGMKLIVYALKQDTENLTDRDILEYIEHIKKFNLPFKFKIHRKYDLNSEGLENKIETVYNIDEDYENIVIENQDYDLIDGDDPEYEYSSELYIRKTIIEYDDDSDYSTTEVLHELNKSNSINFFDNQKVYSIEISLDEHKSFNTVKILCYLFRHIYEFDAPHLIKSTLSYIRRFPKYDIIQSLVYCYDYYRYYHPKFKSNFRLGHFIFNVSTSNIVNLSLESFNEVLSEESKKKYNDNILQNIHKYFDEYVVRYDSRYSHSCYSRINLKQSLKQSIDNYYKLIESSDPADLIKDKRGGSNFKLIKLKLNNNIYIHE